MDEINKTQIKEIIKLLDSDINLVKESDAIRQLKIFHRSIPPNSLEKYMDLKDWEGTVRLITLHYSLNKETG